VPRAWLTPDSIPPVRRFYIDIPDSAEWRAALTGALLEQTNLWRWEQFGTVTPEQAVAAVWAEIESVAEVPQMLLKFAIIEDVRAYTASGGDTLANAAQFRGLNTITYKHDAIDVALHGGVGNAIIVGPGTYRFQGFAPAYKVDRHFLDLYFVPSGEAVQHYYGPTEYSLSSDGVQTVATVDRVLTVATTATVQLNHWTHIAQSGNGYGVNSGVVGVDSRFTKLVVTQLD